MSIIDLVKKQSKRSLYYLVFLSVIILGAIFAIVNLGNFNIFADTEFNEETHAGAPIFVRVFPNWNVPEDSIEVTLDGAGPLQHFIGNADSNGLYTSPNAAWGMYEGSVSVAWEGKICRNTFTVDHQSTTQNDIISVPLFFIAHCALEPIQSVTASIVPSPLPNTSINPVLSVVASPLASPSPPQPYNSVVIYQAEPGPSPSPVTCRFGDPELEQKINKLFGKIRGNTDEYITRHPDQVKTALDFLKDQNPQLAADVGELLTNVPGAVDRVLLAPIAGYMNTHPEIPEKYRKVSRFMGRSDFNKFLIDNVDQVREFVDWADREDPDLGRSVRKALDASPVLIREVLEEVTPSFEESVTQTRQNCYGVDVKLNASEWAKWQFAKIRYGETLPEDVAKSIFENALKRAFVKCSEPMQKHLAGKTAGFLLARPELLADAFNMANNVSVNKTLLNKTYSDGSMFIRFNARPTFANRSIGVIVTTEGDVRFKDYISNLRISYNTCNSDYNSLAMGEGIVTGETKKQINMNFSVYPRMINGGDPKWEFNLNKNYNGTTAQLKWNLLR